MTLDAGMKAEVERLVALQLEGMQAEAPPARAPRRVPLYHEETGEPPPTPDGKVWRADAREWCARGPYVENRSEIQAPKPKRGRKPAAKKAPAKAPAKAKVEPKAEPAGKE